MASYGSCLGRCKVCGELTTYIPAISGEYCQKHRGKNTKENENEEYKNEKENNNEI